MRRLGENEDNGLISFFHCLDAVASIDVYTYWNLACARERFQAGLGAEMAEAVSGFREFVSKCGFWDLYIAGHDAGSQVDVADCLCVAD